MTDYIKRDAVIDYLDSNNMPWRDWVKDIPSADVVEVVRCKDCKHYNEYENGEKIIGEEEVHDGWCMRWSGIENVNRHDYCSLAERAEA